MAGAAIAPALGMISEHFNQTSKILISQIVSIHSIFIIFSAFLFGFLTKYLNAKNIAILGLCLYIICKMLYEMRKREKIVECLGVRY